jgi:hypothetical protein
MFWVTSFLFSINLEKKMTKNKLTERLNKGPVICAEGFLFVIERR